MAEEIRELTSVTEKLLLEAERKRLDDAAAEKQKRADFIKTARDNKRGSEERNAALQELKRMREDSNLSAKIAEETKNHTAKMLGINQEELTARSGQVEPVSYTHLRAHET